MEGFCKSLVIVGASRFVALVLAEYSTDLLKQRALAVDIPITSLLTSL